MEPPDAETVPDTETQEKPEKGETHGTEESDGKALAAKVKAQVAEKAAKLPLSAGAGGGAGRGGPRLASLCPG